MKFTRIFLLILFLLSLVTGSFTVNDPQKAFNLANTIVPYVTMGLFFGIFVRWFFGNWFRYVIALLGYMTVVVDVVRWKAGQESFEASQR